MADRKDSHILGILRMSLFMERHTHTGIHWSASPASRLVLVCGAHVSLQPGSRGNSVPSWVIPSAKSDRSSPRRPQGCGVGSRSRTSSERKAFVCARSARDTWLRQYFLSLSALPGSSWSTGDGVLFFKYGAGSMSIPDWGP